MTPRTEQPSGGSENSTPRHHQLIISLFGLYARAYGGELQVSTIISLMNDLGVESAGVRSSISRLKKRGVIDSVKVNNRNGYALSPSALSAFAEGDERIFTPRRATADSRWLLATFTVPESQRSIRHKIRSTLVRMGFGAVAPGLWIAPEHLKDEALSYFDRHGMADYFEFFLAEHVGSHDLAKNMGIWWDLESLDSLYSEFLETNRPLLEKWTKIPTAQESEDLDAEAFADYLVLITQWRRLPYSDPGLPAELLPEGWNAIAASDLFQQLHEIIGFRASRHAERAISAQESDVRA